MLMRLSKSALIWVISVCTVGSMGLGIEGSGRDQRVARGGAAWVGLGFMLFGGLVVGAAGVVLVGGAAAPRSPDGGLGFGGLGAGTEGAAL